MKKDNTLMLFAFLGLFALLRKTGFSSPSPTEAQTTPAPNLVTRSEVEAIVPAMQHFGLTQDAAVQSFNALDYLRSKYPSVTFGVEESGRITTEWYDTSGRNFHWVKSAYTLADGIGHIENQLRAQNAPM